MTGLVCPNCNSAFDSDKRVVRADVTECKLCQKKFIVTQKTLKSYQKPPIEEPQALQVPLGPALSPSLSKINCPHCATQLQGQISIGQIVACSHCHKQFEATPERLNSAPVVLAKAVTASPEATNQKPKSIAGKLFIIAVGLVFALAIIMPDSKEATTTTNTAAPDVASQPAVTAPPKRDPNDIKSFLSGWDGSNRELVNLVKSAMNDPKSFEHVETRFVDRGNSLSLFMTYRGKNAFGGIVTNKVSAELDKNTRSLSNIQER